MIQRIISLSTLVLFIALNSYAQQGSEYLIKANKASLEKNYEQAIVYYTKYIQLNPKDFRGYFNRGTTKYNAGKLDGGISDFSSCLKLNPIYKEAYYYRAKCKQALNKHTDAIKDYNFVLNKDSLNVAFLKARSESLMFLKRYEPALKDLNVAARVNKFDGDIYKRRAEVKVALNQLLEAIYDYDKVEMMIPEYKMVHYLKGNLYLRLEMMDEACQEWTLALEHDVVVAERNHQTYCENH
jgi:tetratricopeptide (TPR) repeat protein